MRKKKEEKLPVEQDVQRPVPKRRGRPSKKAVQEGEKNAASENVLMVVSEAEDKLRKIQQDYTLAEKELNRVQKEKERLLKKCDNIKLLLASYYNLEEKGSDKLLVPEMKTPYWYIRATFGKNYFDVVECNWIGGISDKFRYCRGNFFLDRHTADMVCNACNELMRRI